MNCFTGLIGILSVIGLALSSFAQGAPAPDATPMSLTAKLEKEQVVISAGGKLFTVYKFTGSQKYPYFWPVNGPTSGRSVTVETSEPFPHHHSLFFGCDRVNRGNYWQDTNERGQIVSQGPKIIEALGERVVFTDECLWRQPGKAPIIRDLRRIVVIAPNEKLRLIDFDITLEPLVDVRIDKTNHSLFSARVMPDLSVKSGGTLINAGGKTGEKGTWGTSSPWCDYFGEREGQIEGIAIFQNPDNRWFPSKWFTRDYGFFSPTPMFWPEGSYTALPKGEALTLRYRVVVHAGDVKGAGIANLYEQYAASGAAERLDQLLGKLKTYEPGQSRGPLLSIGKQIRESHGSPQQRKAIEERLSAVLQTDATRACKHFICLQLSEIGTERSVPVLAA
ncbi:MAG: PmoA family protein [Planctomycetota bacterium]|nr:PmoA family protein [Planctomycetota bacterium]